MRLDDTEPDSLYRLLRRSSSFTVLQTSVAWILCFIEYLKQRSPNDFNNSPLSHTERSKATMAVVKLVQTEAYTEVLKILPNHSDFEAPVMMNPEEQLKAHACLRVVQDLDPDVVDGVSRVGGRLRNSQSSASTKHPILLPSNHHVTDLLILHIIVKKVILDAYTH